MKKTKDFHGPTRTDTDAHGLTQTPKTPSDKSDRSDLSDWSDLSTSSTGSTRSTGSTLSTSPFGLLAYVTKRVVRQRLRTLLTVGGIATAMLLFCFIEGLQSGVREATESEATKNVLIVYQKSRFCPATSLLPERYGDEIARMPGVKSVLPVKIFVNNCRTSLDNVTFRGVPAQKILSGEKALRLESGSLGDFDRRSDAALVGNRLAQRRHLKVGERFQIGNIPVQVAGIFATDIPGEDNVAYTRLDFLQRKRGVNSLGRVTQFDVTIQDASQANRLAKAIDERFRSDEVQTTTKTHKAFVTSATGDLLGLVRFTRLLGLLCVLVVLALAANTVYVMVQERVREHAVLQTLGFSATQLFGMVLAESLLLSAAGGLLGTFAATAALHWGHLGFGSEGVNISFILAPGVVAVGMAVSFATGLLAGLLPAVQAAFTPIVDALRRG